MKKKQPRTEPRDINKEAWYYAGNTHVTLCAVFQGDGFRCTHTTLTRKTLKAMLADIKPRAKSPKRLAR